MPVKDYKAQTVLYETSGSITGDYTNSVSYASIVVSGALSAVKDTSSTAANLTPDEKRFLLMAARGNIRSWLEKGKAMAMPENVPANCMLKRGAFVTLKKHGELRGCIGYINTDKPLIHTVLENSYNAAFLDSRFTPLRLEELKDITIEISVLTEPETVKSPAEIKPGRDGLIIERGKYRGLLLPQVADEHGWDVLTFLGQTCIKAGLPADSWKDRRTRIYRFQAVVFGEGELK
jgi:AmmeMemoRadiSam system protein A